MNDFHGIIFAYSPEKELSELTRLRTAAALPFCGRYRMIDFSLSAMTNAGIRNVGVIMQRDYQSLLDHLGSGKAWDLSRKQGGLHMLPPFGLPEYHSGNYIGTIEALNAVSSYVRRIQEDNVVLMMGHLCANIDLFSACTDHVASGADITAICADHDPKKALYRYVPGEDGFVKSILFSGSEGGLPSLECYIIRKSVLLDMMEQCRASNQYRFHHDAVSRFLQNGGKMSLYVHKGYAETVHSVKCYFDVSMDMLKSDVRHDIFNPARPVRTRAVEEVSTYYGEKALSHNCLVADNCIIEGDMENCIVFSGARIEPGAKLKNCIVMSGCSVGKDAALTNVIVDRNVSISAGTTLTGSEKLPMVIPMGEVL